MKQRLFFSGAMIVLTCWLGYGIERPGFGSFFGAYGLFFGLYALLLFQKKAAGYSLPELRWYIGLGIFLRVLLLFSIPRLSDDFYRFLWDGHLTVAGIHPFAHPPSYYMANPPLPRGITPELFAQLNSPQYYTVYPPVCQAVFALAAWCAGDNLWAGGLVMKLFLLACEVGSMWLLSGGWRGEARASVAPSGPPGGGESEQPLAMMERDAGSKSHSPSTGRATPGGPGWAAAAYALNPLLILEIAGNCHFEGAMIFFLLAGLRALERQKAAQAAGWWALATATKLLPLMFLPILWFRLGRYGRREFAVVFAGACLLLFLPLLGVLPNIFSSLDLYFRQFQFNGSMYYLLRGAGFLLKGFDIGETLGPLLGIVTVAGILIFSICPTPEGRGALTQGLPVEPGCSTRPLVSGEGPGAGLTEPLIFALFLQLTHAAAVHPWYITVLFALGLRTQWRFPVVWTGLVALSYSHYAGGRFQENYWLIALEYALLWACFLWEMKMLPVPRRSGRP